MLFFSNTITTSPPPFFSSFSSRTETNTVHRQMLISQSLAIHNVEFSYSQCLKCWGPCCWSDNFKIFTIQCKIAHHRKHGEYADNWSVLTSKHGLWIFGDQHSSTNPIWAIQIPAILILSRISDDISNHCILIIFQLPGYVNWSNNPGKLMCHEMVTKKHVQANPQINNPWGMSDNVANKQWKHERRNHTNLKRLRMFSQ